MDAKNVLTIGIDYRVVHGGVAAVENVYSTFYKPFNHVATVVDYGRVRKLMAFFKAYAEFWRWMLFHKEIKIVHVHGASNVSFWRKKIFINLAKMFGKKVVYHCHGGGFKRFANNHLQTVTNTLKRCDCIIALSESWKQWFEETIHHNNVIVVKNVIPYPCLHSVKHDKFTLIFLGRLCKLKGIYDLLDVLSEHKDEFAGKIEFLFGGDGDVDEVLSIIKRNGIENIAKFQGWVDGSKKEMLLNAADAYILPSYYEGLPISILEAMSYSLPVISTNVGGIPEILKNGENGYIMEPGDKQAIYHAIKQLLTDREKAKVMGEISYQKVQEHFPDFVDKQLDTLYKSLL